MRRLAFTVLRNCLGFFVRRVKVEGTSMLPTYRPGEILTVFRRWRPIHVGDVVVLRDPREDHHWLLKRCVARSRRMLDVRGDNEEASTDSRHFGLVRAQDVRYVVPPRRP